MPTVLDSLVIRLGLDTARFQKGQKTATDGLKNLSQQNDKVNAQMAKGLRNNADEIRKAGISLRTAVGGMLAGAAFKSFLTNTTNTDAAIGRMSRNLGIATQRLDAYKRAAQSIGGSGQEGLQAAQAVANGISQVRINPANAQMAAMLRRYGISMGPNDSVESVFDKISARMQQFRNRNDALQMAGSLGINDTMAQLLLRGPAQFDALISRFQGNSQLTGGVADRAQRLQAQANDLKNSIGQLGNEIYGSLEPSLEPLIRDLSQWIRSNQGLINSDVTGVAKAFFGVVEGGVKVINEADHATHGLSTQLIAAYAALRLLGGTSMLSGIGRLVGLLTSTAGAGTVLGALTGVGAAAAGGYGIGTMISNHLSPGASNAIGGGIATVLAVLGNKSAQNALDMNRYGATGQGSPTAPANLMRTPLGLMAPLGIRYNNPGNLRSGGNGRFGSYATPQLGLNAMGAQLERYFLGKTTGKRLTTLQSIISTYAPSSDHNNTAAYISDVAKRMGVGAGSQLNLNDPNVMQALMTAMITHEQGYNPYSAQSIRAGAMMGISGARAGASASQAGTVVNNVHHETHIGAMNVHTPATDGVGVASAIRQQFKSNALTGGGLVAMA